MGLRSGLEVLLAPQDVIERGLDVATLDIELADGVGVDDAEEDRCLGAAVENEAMIVTADDPRTQRVPDGAGSSPEVGGAKEENTVLEEVQVVEDPRAVGAWQFSLEACRKIAQ
jgi:hypothetical protein